MSGWTLLKLCLAVGGVLLIYNIMREEKKPKKDPLKEAFSRAEQGPRRGVGNVIDDISPKKSDSTDRSKYTK